MGGAAAVLGAASACPHDTTSSACDSTRASAGASHGRSFQPSLWPVGRSCARPVQGQCSGGDLGRAQTQRPCRAPGPDSLVGAVFSGAFLDEFRNKAGAGGPRTCPGHFIVLLEGTPGDPAATSRRSE